MNQVQQLIVAGYVTRKQAAELLGKGDGGNVTTLCKAHSVKFVEIPRGETRVTTLFLGADVVRLADKMNKKRTPKQAELPATRKPDILPPAKTLLMDSSEIVDLLYAIDAKLTALLKRGEAV